MVFSTRIWVGNETDGGFKRRVKRRRGKTISDNYKLLLIDYSITANHHLRLIISNQLQFLPLPIILPSPHLNHSEMEQSTSFPRQVHLTPLNWQILFSKEHYDLILYSARFVNMSLNNQTLWFNYESCWLEWQSNTITTVPWICLLLHLTLDSIRIKVGCQGCNLVE